MNKKFFGLMLTFTLVLSQAVVAFAAPSKDAQVSGSGDTKVEALTNFGEIVSDEEALSILELAVNTNATDAEIVNALNKTGDVDIKQATFATTFVSVESAKSVEGLYQVSLKVPSLPANASVNNVRGIRYSEAKGVWEVVTPVSVKGGVVEFAFADLSPIAVYVTGTSTSPVTGASSNWALFMGAAVVLFAVSAAASKKARN